MGLPPAGSTPRLVEIEVSELWRLVCGLKKALYGHPNTGAYWEEKRDAHVQSVGFAPIGPEWPSCYYHPKTVINVVGLRG